MTLRITIFFSIVLCLIMSPNLHAQKGDMVLTFSGKDAVTSNIVALESVKVSNETQGGDTTLYGVTPTLSLQWASGIFEQNRGQKASFILEPNYPNPFTENTTVNIRLRKPQHLIITLYDQQGAVSENLEQDFGFGTHRFEIKVPQNRLYLLTVNDGVTTKTLKMFSTSGKDYRIKYLGTDENTGYKSETETTAFVFQPGDVLKYTVNAVGYFEYSTFDNPIVNMDYVFSLQPNTNELPPTVTTAAITNITATSATSGGNVTSEGSAAVTVRGVCWSASQNPTIANSFTADGAGTGAFTSAVTSLTESTTYYARAYATNQFGTAYGNEVSFTTASLEPFYACDSAITYSNQNGIEKTIYTLDATGKLLKVVYKDLNTTYGVWVNHWQELYTYNSQGNRLSSLSQIWDINIGIWVNDGQSLYTYDDQGNQLSWLEQHWNTNIGSWVNAGQELYTYDAQGNQLSYLDQYWNTEIGSWVNIWQYLYSYDAQGNQLSRLGQSWNTDIGSWVNAWQDLYTYDASGNMLSALDQGWNTNIGSWVNNYQYLFTYDASNNMLSEIYQNWETNIGSWVNIWQYLYSYDPQGNQLSRLGQSWNTNIGSWVNTSQGLYTYDASKNMLSALDQIWNTNIGSWVNYEQTLFTYDTQANLLIEVHQVWYANYGTWVNYNKYEYQFDYTAKKIIAMYYEWSGGWAPSDLDYFDIYILDTQLFSAFECYKIELWYNSYPSINKENNRTVSRSSDLFGISKTSNGRIFGSNPYEKEAGFEDEFISPKHAKETWLNKNENRLPSQNLPQRNMLVGKSTRDLNHSK